MSDTRNASKNGKRRKSIKNGNGHSNGHNNGNSNGESLLAPLLPYEVTKRETVTKEETSFVTRHNRCYKEKTSRIE